MKKWLVSLLLILGGIMVFFSLNNNSYDERQSELKLLREEQTRMVQFTKNKYENIEKVEFTSFQKNTSTQTWTANAIINNDIYVTFSIQDIGIESEIGLGQHITQSQGNRLTSKDSGENFDKFKNVEIIYWEKLDDK